MKLNPTEVKTLIEQAKAANTYICGADGKLCGMARTNTPFPCKQCKRNHHHTDTRQVRENERGKNNEGQDYAKSH